MRELIIVALLSLVVSSPVDAQTCLKCKGDGSAYVGCFYSCFPFGCDEPCGSGLAEIGYLDIPQPGFFVEQRGGRRWVESIIPGSPASRVLFPGDEVVAVNPGKPPSCRASWESSSGAGTVELTIRRDGLEFGVTVRLAPTRSYLDEAWSEQSSPVRNVRLTSGRLSRSYGLYGFGFDVERINDHFVVSGVLHGSPAQRIGLSVGDTLITIDGQAPNGYSDEALQSRLWPTARTVLSIVPASSSNEIRLNAVSVNELLRGLGNEPHSVPPTVASTR
jgi:C-terminal processing protease CtpA/Prc